MLNNGPMPRSILEEIINDFQIEKFSEFFNLKMRPQGNFRPSTEKLSSYNDIDFSDFKKIGQIEFSPTEKLVIVGSNSIKSLSERSGKKNQFKKAKQILKDLSSYSAGIFIFFDSVGNFRFSLVYPEAIGTKREWSNFRRYTYFVSKEFTNKTFLQKIGNVDFSTFEKVKDVFSVEKVTKEFYSEYRKLFDSLVKELSGNHTFIIEASKNNINTEDFAKKLLGQIVFLYFVQKKGWIGVPSGEKWGEGNKNFISDLFKEAVKKEANFFNDYLEKLFYNALNNSRRNSADPSFSKDFNCRIPFLNGGLFEAEYDWQNSLIYLNNKIFEDICEVFDRYNFTVEEESPDDKEIAVDPEMLGKVFENLLPENLRKGKGTYYTPREIVYYMCQESLINYLDSNSSIGRKKAEHYVKFMRDGESKPIAAFEEEAVKLDELLKNIKVCDPACGSGAFLVGMLNEIVRLRILLRLLHSENLDKKTEYELKKETIQNCIYGVDIDPGAIEIAKLRLWLSLVVDYELEEIEPLPNLDYRLMCGNSLLEEFEGVKFYNGEESEQKTLLVDANKQRKITELKVKLKEYFNIHDDEQKKIKRKEINDIKDWLVRSALEKKQKDLAAKRRSEEAKADMLDKKSRDKYILSWGNKFLAEEKIKEVLGNLHNPKKTKPFFIWKLEFIDVFEDKKGFDVVIANPPYVTTKYGKIDKDLKDTYKKCFESAYDKLDLYVLFIEKAVKISRDHGFTTFITPWNFLANFYSFKIRKFLLENTKIKLFNKLQPHVFGSIIVDNIISIFERSKDNNGNQILFDDLFDKNNQKYVNQEAYSKDKKYIFTFPGNNIADGILEKMKNDSLELNEIALNYIGIMTGGQKQMIANAPTFKNSKPVLGGKDIAKWKLFDRGNFVNFDKSKIHSNDNEDVYLSHKKILLRKTGRQLVACIDREQFFTIQSLYNIIVKDKKYTEEYLLSLLNSKLFTYIYNNFFITNPEVFPYIKRRNLDQFPIKIVSEDDQKPFIKIVDKILTTAKNDNYSENLAKQATVKEYEKKIDQMVYKLYNLTPEEIVAVEGL